MKSTPHVIQLSRLQAPVIGKGRPYTVDFGIAKPFYKQLISSWADALSSNRLFILGAVSLLYIGVILSFFPSSHITYTDPILPAAPLEPIAQLTIPIEKPVQPVSYVTTPLADNLPNLFVPLNCTAFVASKLPVPSSWGNAGDWADNALAQGYIITHTPVVGTIAQTSGDSYLGHVAIVTAVNPDGTFTVEEQNYYGLGVIDERATTTAEFQNFIFV